MGVKIRMAFESDGAGVSSNWNNNYKSSSHPSPLPTE